MSPDSVDWNYNVCYKEGKKEFTEYDSYDVFITIDRTPTIIYLMKWFGV